MKRQRPKVKLYVTTMAWYTLSTEPGAARDEYDHETIASHINLFTSIEEATRWSMYTEALENLTIAVMSDTYEEVEHEMLRDGSPPPSANDLEVYRECAKDDRMWCEFLHIGECKSAVHDNVLYNVMISKGDQRKLNLPNAVLKNTISEWECPVCGWDTNDDDEQENLVIRDNCVDFAVNGQVGSRWTETWRCPQCGKLFTFENASL